jgi:O-antigen/teichoic acid export membrane protein
MGKGIIYYLISRSVFVAGAYAIHIYIARLLGPEPYGVFNVCLSIITICYVFLGNGVMQVVSKSSAKFPHSAKDFLKKGASIQLLLSMMFGLLLVVFSGPIARSFKEPGLEKLLYLSALVIISRSLFFVFIGVLNGIRRFGAENLVRGVHGLLRAVTAILFVYLGFEIVGALSGLLVGSLAAVLLGYLLTRNLGAEKQPAVRLSDIFLGAVPVMIIYGTLTAIINIDLLAVKYVMGESQFTGYYASASAVSKIIFWIVLAYSAVLLPFVSASYFRKNFQEAGQYVARLMRYSFLVLTPLVLLGSFYSREVIQIVYGHQYMPAAAALRILIWGFLALGFCAIISVAMIGIDREKTMIKIVLIGLGIALLLNILLVPLWGLMGAAVATCFSSLVIAAVSYSYIYKRLRMPVSLKSLFKSVTAWGIMLLGAFGLAGTHIHVAAKGVILYTGYVLFLFLVNEADKKDINDIKNLVAGFLTGPGRST